ncbi:MAG TPA: hypothetical protein VHU86_01355 [Solirubrobacterales bacterium]|jgi:hypothetical protein|nr:hypothetical protein [Solirubrobacterales bacterium]
MTDRWEYMSVVWTYEAKPLPGSAENRQWAFKEDFWIWHPGAETAEHRPYKDTQEKNVSGTPLLTILNEFGAQGWEVITETLRESAAGKRRGWPEAAYPIVRQWLLKRRVAVTDA